jgi:hypothetical protein
MKCAEVQLILQGFNCGTSEANAYSQTIAGKLGDVKEHIATCFNCEKLALSLLDKHEYECHLEDSCLCFLLEVVSEGTDFNYPNFLNIHEIANALPDVQRDWLLSYTTRYYPLNRKEKEALKQAEPTLCLVIDEFNTNILIAPTVEEAVKRLNELYERNMKQN